MSEILTNSSVSKLSPRDKRFWVSDLKCPGLTLSVYPSGSKVYYYRYKHKGSRKNNSTKVGNANVLSISAARQAASVLIGDLAKGVDLELAKQQRLDNEKLLSDKKSLTLFNYIDEYYEPYAKQHTVSSKEIVKTLKKEFKFLQNKPIEAIDNLDIDKWRLKRAKDNITFARIQRIYTYLKACINTAVKHYKLIKYFELQHYTLKRKSTERVNPPKIRYLLRDEETILISALEKRDQSLREQRKSYVEWLSTRNSHKKKLPLFQDDDYPDHISPIIYIAYQTGYDLGDIFDLNWKEHIDFNNNQIRKVRNKTQHSQNNPLPVVVPMTDKVREVLAQWAKQHGMDGRVFPSPVTDGRLDNIKKSWTAIRNKANLTDFRFKDLRHTFGSWLAIAGVDLLDIRDLMGHKDIKTTQIYAHLCPKKKTEAMLAVFA